MGSGGSLTIESCLDNLGYTANRYANTDAYYVRRTMNNDKIFAIISHGAPGRVVCKNGITTVSANSVATDNNNYSLAACFGSNAFNGMLFAYYGACQTAATDATYDNLLSYTTGTLGARSALGFQLSVNNSQATYFEAKLFEYLEDGNTVYTACGLARSATYTAYSNYGNVDSAVVAGNPHTTIN